MNSGNIEIKIDRIAILSSLGNKDIGVVKRLYSNIEDLREGSLVKLKLDHFEISNKAEFESVVYKLASEVPTLGTPLVHLETHGKLNKGLILNNDDVIEWKVLSEYLSIINKPTGNRMVVLSNACFSLEAIAHFDISKPASFSYFIGPSKEVTNEYLENHLIKFYSKLLEGESIEKLKYLLGSQFFHYVPENLIFYIVRDELRSFTGRASARKREDAITNTKNQLEKNGVEVNLRKIRKAVKNIEVELTDERLNLYLNTFMCGRAPFFSSDDIRKSKDTPEWVKLITASKAG